ncbi:MAG: GldG family protein [Proteobacteria bacterium]|nr:GldG family protein [Pseudomonadota bacterium]MBU4471598.1 GldG family protein [Pseudomonadota bacterium]MCG2751080.1 GldG family protein [Desulfobacteraceae bacterium]
MAEMKTDISKTLFSAVGLPVVFLIIILVNVLFSGLNLKWDLTEEKLYSVSDATRKILSEIPGEVSIKVFYTKGIENIPVPIKDFAPRMLDFLREYHLAGKGKIKLEIYNPGPDSEEEEWAKQYGIKDVDLPNGDTLYFGLVVISEDREETLEFMDPTKEKHMEYDISHAITKVITPIKPKIGILSFMDIYGNPPPPVLMPESQPEKPPWYFITALEKTYDVTEINMAATSFDEDLDLLFLVFTKNMSDQLLYAVDQFVLNGGKLIVFADPFSMIQLDVPDFAKWYAPDALFSAWGVKMDSQQALVDFGYATRYMDRSNQVVENPFWLSLEPSSFNPGNVISANLETMLFSISGVIQKEKDTGLQYEPLIQSSLQSQTINRNSVRFGPADVRRNFKASEKKQDMAVLLSGVFESAFPKGPPANPSVTKGWGKPHLAKGIKPSSVLIVADADMISDINYVEHKVYLGQTVSEPYNDNLNFILNTCEILTGNEELVNIRSRGKFERPFVKVVDLEKKAQVRWLAQEQGLMKKMEESTAKLEKLEKLKDASQKFIVSPDQEKELQNFKKEKLAINKKLKEVRRNLRADIDRLGMKVKLANIFMMPLLISILGIAYAVYKRNRAAAHKNKEPV